MDGMQQAVTRVALYTRVSTEDQAKEGFSLDAQLDRLRLYARAQAWHVAGEYIDEGHSGRTTKRPAYQRMMTERGTWDTLLVLKMDRIHRNSRNFMAMMDGLTCENKGFASVTESLDTATAMGRFVMDIIQRIAQLESEQIGERVYIGMEQKAKTSGGSLGKPAPFGYRYDGDGRLQPVPEEAPFVVGAFERFAAGERKKQVADWLAGGGTRGRGGAAWNIRNLTHVLTNPVYAGAIHWQNQLQIGAHQAIVGAALYDKAQALIRRRSPRRRVYFLRTLEGPEEGLAHR